MNPGSDPGGAFLLGFVGGALDRNSVLLEIETLDPLVVRFPVGWRYEIKVKRIADGEPHEALDMHESER